MNFLKHVEKLVFIFCAVIIMVFILVQMVEAGYSIYQAFVLPNTTRLIFSRAEIANLLVILFSIFIALEILETIKIYLQKGHIPPHLILEIGLIAVVRKLLTVDVSHTEPVRDIALGVLIFLVAVSFWIVKKMGQKENAEVEEHSA